MENFFTTPLGLIQVGLASPPHFDADTNPLNLDRTAQTQLEEVMFHALDILKPVLMTASLHGYQVPYLYLTEVKSGSVTDFRLDMRAQEISTVITSRANWQPPEGCDNQNGILFFGDLEVNVHLAQAMTLSEFPWGNQQSQVVFCFLPETAVPLFERLFNVERSILATANAIEATIEIWLTDFFETSLGSTWPADWIRHEKQGLFPIYEYTYWKKDRVLEIVGNERISTVGREVWDRRMRDSAAFVAFLKGELGLNGAGKCTPALQLMKALDVERSAETMGERPVKMTEHIESWTYIWNTYAGEDNKDKLTLSELKHLSYTELLMAMHEAGVLDVLAFTSVLDSETLREIIRQEMDEWEEVARDGINRIADWLEANYDDLSIALAGDIIPSYLSGQLHNLAGNLTGTVTGAIAGSFFSPGVGTFIGGAVGFLVSDLWGMIITSQGSYAEQMAAVDAAQRAGVLSRAFREQIEDQKQHSLTLMEARAQDARDMVNDSQRPDNEITAYYLQLVDDLDRLEAVVSQIPNDLSLSELYLRLWIIERGWGLYEPTWRWWQWPYWWPTGVSEETNFVAFTNNRARILGKWRSVNNPKLYIDQCEFEWRSFGLDCDYAINNLRATATNDAAKNQKNLNNVQFTFHGLSIPERWDAGVIDITQANLYPPGVTFKWEEKLHYYATALAISPTISRINYLNPKGIDAIARGDFRLKCNLELKVTNQCCHVERFHYRFEWDHTDYAYTIVSDGGNIKHDPIDFFECRIRPDMPVFA